MARSMAPGPLPQRVHRTCWLMLNIRCAMPMIAVNSQHREQVRKQRKAGAGEHQQAAAEPRRHRIVAAVDEAPTCTPMTIGSTA